MAGTKGPEAEVRFVLTGEVSCIYKQAGRTRKVHLVILMPTFEAARKFNGRLLSAGVNLASDGRPIMGLKARQVLEVVLETDPLAEMIPAHIWTPWFSVLGSKSGFESMADCFGDLTPYIHAVETGLSSDPPMNWRVSSLDGFHLVSSSDAHSPAKLGREAVLLSGPLTYQGLIESLRTGQGLEGTLEFFPEEGKYHLDGHRKCGVRLSPKETLKLNGICPVCGQPVTVGVLNRVEALADREEFGPDGPPPPESVKPFESLLTLSEIAGQVLRVGPQSKKVARLYDELLARLGPELFILRQAPLEDIDQVGGPVLAEGIKRVRAGQVTAAAGFDGQFGRLTLFSPQELAELNRQGRLFALDPVEPRPEPGRLWAEVQAGGPTAAPLFEPETLALTGLRPDPDQEAALEAGPGPLLILAGPGGGKTGVLIRRIRRLIEKGADPARTAVLTFTRKAAQELKDRLARADGPSKVVTATFHSLGLSLLQEWGLARPVLSEEERLSLIRPLAKKAGLKPGRAAELIAGAKLGLGGDGPVCPPGLLKSYQEAQAAEGVLDYEDLIDLPLDMARQDKALARSLAQRFDHLLIDEFQDLNPAQFKWLDLLAPEADRSLTVVGDPDQSIYGFRGASPAFFELLAAKRPGLKTIRLKTSYRCCGPVLAAAQGLISHNPGLHLDLRPCQEEGPNLSLAALASPKAEAVFIVQEMERLLGGTSHLAQALGGQGQGRECGLAEMAVLFRLHRQAEDLAWALDKAGLPFQTAGQEPGREIDGLDLEADKITLLTFHAAKGLEFTHVFLAGLEQGLLPYQPPGGPAPGGPETAEERRLLYVALTRAQRQVILTRARKRTLFGVTSRPGPSPFLQDMPARLIKEMKVAPPVRRQVQPELF
ncbi:MAG: UvrD-helicase domain-containing protein [Deltaproteobacteria bacterium]|nr:UvrD-helicase domain-containing protein [Deltaproteobacteria bacterium]